MNRQGIAGTPVVIPALTWWVVINSGMEGILSTADAFAAEREKWHNFPRARPGGIVGLSWLNARVGRRIPVMGIRSGYRHTTNSRARVKTSAAAALQPTVYLPPLTDKKLVA